MRNSGNWERRARWTGGLSNDQMGLHFAIGLGLGLFANIP